VLRAASCRWRIYNRARDLPGGAYPSLPARVTAR
jgi:hypothetical protein